MVWSRLAHFGTSGTARVPTLWIVLGPLGHSITASGLLGTNAALAVDPHLADGMGVFAILYGVPVWGFAVLWISLATSLYRAAMHAVVVAAREVLEHGTFGYLNQSPPTPDFSAFMQN